MPLSEEQIQALLRLGASQLELGQLRQAEKTYQTLLRAMPAHAEALFGLAGIAAARHKPRKQRELLAELVSVHPQHLPGVLSLIRLLGGEDPAQALAVLERALEALPMQPELLLEAAVCLQQLGQFERARFYLEQITQAATGPLTGRAWVQLGRLQLRSGELQRAAEAFERAAALDPGLSKDPDWLDVEAKWRQLEARAEALDWQALEHRLEGRN